MKKFVRAAGARVTPRFVVVAAVMGALAVTGAVAPVAAQAASCSGLQIVYARGTGEEANPYGAILGNTLVADLQADVPGTTAVAVKYPASLASSSPTEGNSALVNYVTKEAAECPSQKFVLAGYSQGANVVAMSFGLNTSGTWVGGPSVAQLPASLASHVTAVLMFGPPYNQIGRSVPSPYGAVTDQVLRQGGSVLQHGTEPGLRLPHPSTGVSEQPQLRRFIRGEQLRERRRRLGAVLQPPGVRSADPRRRLDRGRLRWLP